MLTLRYTDKQTHSRRQRLGGWSSWCTFLTISGFLGEFCDLPVNRCASSPCYNGGTCTVDSSGNPVCSCPTGEWPSHLFQHSHHKKIQSLLTTHSTNPKHGRSSNRLSVSQSLSRCGWLDRHAERERTNILLAKGGQNYQMITRIKTIATVRVVYIQVPVDPGVRSSPKRVSRTPVKMAGPAGTTSTPLPACVHSASLATGQSTSVIGHQHLHTSPTD